jgi:hypothetical protein
MAANRDSDRLETLIDLSVTAIERVLRDGKVEEDDLVIANMGKSVISTWAKLKQTERAQDAMYFVMARELLDKEKLQEYIRLTLPAGSLKGLTSGKSEE